MILVLLSYIYGFIADKLLKQIMNVKQIAKDFYLKK